MTIQSLLVKQNWAKAGSAYVGDNPSGGDNPTGGARTITGVGFGLGPNVVLYDTFQANTSGQLVDLSGADVGSWAGYNNDSAGSSNTAYAYDFNDRTWLATRNPANTSLNASHLSSLQADFGQPYKNFTQAFRWVVPTGFKFTDSATTNTIGSTSGQSRFKMAWLYEDSITTNPDDVVIPTVVASGMSVVGNGVDPRSQTNGRLSYSYSDCSGVNENLFVWSQTENTDSNWDGVIETVQHTNGYYNRTTETDCKPFEANVGTPPFAGYQKAFVPGWYGNHDSFIDSQVLYGDYYFAVGENHRAMLLTHDASTLASSTNVFVIAADTWTDGTITYSPKPYQDQAFVSVIDADGTIQEGLTYD